MTEKRKRGPTKNPRPYSPIQRAHADAMRAERNEKILTAAVEIATAEKGVQWLTREAVAQRAGVSVGSVNNAFGRMVDLKRAVLREAVSREIVEIVAPALAEGHPLAQDASPELKKRAAQHVASAF